VGLYSRIAVVAVGLSVDVETDQRARAIDRRQGNCCTFSTGGADLSAPQAERSSYATNHGAA